MARDYADSWPDQGFIFFEGSNGAGPYDYSMRAVNRCRSGRIIDDSICGDRRAGSKSRGTIGNLVIANAGRHIGESSLRIDVVGFSPLDQREYDRGVFAAAIGTREQLPPPPAFSRSHRTPNCDRRFKPCAAHGRGLHHPDA